MDIYTVKYGVENIVPISFINEDGITLDDSITLASGDVKISKDNGDYANVNALPTIATGTGAKTWWLTLSAAECTCKYASIQMVDQDGPDWLEAAVAIQTTGHANAANPSVAQTADNDTKLTSILEDTGTTLPSTLSTMEGKIDTVDSNVDAVLEDTGTTLPATLTTIEGKVDTVDSNVDLVLEDTGTTLPASLSTIDGNVDSILTDTGTTLPAQISGLNDLSAADVNAEVLDVVNTDTFAEPGQGAPAATASLVQKIGYLYKAWRNKKTQTSTTFSLYDDAGSTVDQKSTDSDDGSTATKGEITTGP